MSLRGPLAVSMDLGVPCNDVNINKPVSGVRSGESYTEYNAIVCGNYVASMRYDSPIIDLNQSFGTSSVRRSLLEDIGAAENTISVDEREIDGKPGAVVSGYVPKYHMTAYLQVLMFRLERWGILEFTATNTYDFYPEDPSGSIAV